MKDKRNVSPLEVGAGVGLIFVSVVLTLIDFELLPHTISSFATGLMIATGLFSEADKNKACRKRKAQPTEESIV